MSRSTQLWFEVVAFAITIAALLVIAALAVRLGAGWGITTSMFPAFFCVFMGVAAERRRTRRRDSEGMSIKDELGLRRLRAQGARIQFR